LHNVFPLRAGRKAFILAEKQYPECTFDDPIDFSTEEIASVAIPVNTLLKSTYLLGIQRDVEEIFHSLFDIAEEIAGVDRCAYVSVVHENDGFEIVSTRVTGSRVDQTHLPLDPVAIARHFGKVVLLDGEKEGAFRSICERWDSSSLAVFPLRREREFIGALIFGRKESQPFTKSTVKLLWVLAVRAETLLMQSEAVKALSYYALLDPLTHLYNRRYFDNQVEKEILRARRNGNPFSLLMLGLDGLHAYNDRFLHVSGDIALQEIATILQDTVREVDTVARLEGDEFAVILVESPTDGARDLAERLIDRIGTHLLPGFDNARTERLSASIGIATFPADAFSKEDLIRQANRALTMAKHQGGGQICLFHEFADLTSMNASSSDIPIQKIYTAARSVVDMDRFLEILLFTAMQGMSAGRGSIVLLDPQGTVTIRSAIGFTNGEERFSPGTTIPPGNITSWVVEHKIPLVVSGPDDMPPSIPLKRNGYRADTFLSIPLIQEGRLLGALHLTNKFDEKPFTKADLALFDPITKEIASILSQGIDFQENVRWFSTSMFQSLSSALELRFPFLTGHSKRVQELAVGIGRRIGMQEEDLLPLATAARIHDIGLVGIPGRILWKKRKLTAQEREIVKKHPFLGAKLLEGIPGMDETRRIILEHQEFHDGSGYPHGLRGEEICRGARILSIAEFFDSITSERPHRGGLRPEEATQIIRNSMGKIFDEEVCLAFLEQRNTP